MNAKVNSAADSFAAILENVPAAFRPTARRMVIKAVVDEYIDRCYESNGSTSQYSAGIGAMKLLGEINEASAIDMRFFEKYARDRVVEVYSARNDRLSARVAAAFRNTPTQFTTHEYRAAVEAFVAPQLGTGIGADAAQCEIGARLLEMFAPEAKEALG